MANFPADFLSCAQASYNGATEIDYRNCISRAYYGMYHAALLVADAHFPDKRSHLAMGEHERLSKRFHDANDRKAAGVGYALEVMKRSRRRADYELADTIDANDASQALASARSFPALLAKCTSQTASTAQPASKPGQQKTGNDPLP